MCASVNFYFRTNGLYNHNTASFRICACMHVCVLAYQCSNMCVNTPIHTHACMHIFNYSIEPRYKLRLGPLNLVGLRYIRDTLQAR
jgi:hypothetical protein